MCLQSVAGVVVCKPVEIRAEPCCSHLLIVTGKEAVAKFHRGEYDKPNIVLEDPSAAGDNQVLSRVVCSACVAPVFACVSLCFSHPAPALAAVLGVG